MGEYLLSGIDGQIIELQYFNTFNHTINASMDLSIWFSENVYKKLEPRLSDFQDRDSGWALHRIVELLINVNTFEPINGSCHISLPPFKQNKKNVEIIDSQCFKWAILASMCGGENPILRPLNGGPVPINNPQRVSQG